MENYFSRLDWDSTFFEFNVCRIHQLPVTKQEVNAFLKAMEEEDIALAYFGSIEEVRFPEKISDAFDIIPIDKKTTYSKHLNQPANVSPHIKSYPAEAPDEQLLKLAVESGIYSRFHLDPNIPNEKFESLYKLWITNSVNKKIAQEVLVYYVKDEIAGFVTLGEKKNRADIGIIAVDSAFRGRGIATALMHAAENWFIENGFEDIQVVTQGENLAACRLYERCGYAVGRVERFYHLWRKE